MDNKVERDQEAKELLEELNRIEDTKNAESVIKDNKIVFTIDDKKYRVRQLNFREQKELEKVKREKYIEFVNDEAMLFRKQWIKKYKEKGIDIDELDKKFNNKIQEIERLEEQIIKNKNLRKKLKPKIQKFKEESIKLNMQKEDLLSYSIEDQIFIEANSYLTYLSLEKKEGDKWIRVFASYEDFMNSDDNKLLSSAFYNINLISFGGNR